jgi:lipoprotein NlpD
MRRAAGLCLVGIMILAAGCASRQPAPVTERRPPPKTTPLAKKTAPPVVHASPATRDERPRFHTVQPGETLYGIAAAHGLDHRELGIWNGVDNPSALQVGMQLRLTPPPWASAGAPAAAEVEAAASTAPLYTAPDTIDVRPLPGSEREAAPASVPIVTEPKAVRLPYSDQALAQLSRSDARAPAREPPSSEAKPAVRAEAAPPTVRVPARSGWVWPASGKLIATFEGNSQKGIDIGGQLGQPVVASAAGRVIFSGTMRGLGKVIVIQHAEELISVYAHNHELLVKQGQEVARGQKIAEMGATDAEQAKLHFQIRRRGNPNPIDPLSILPERAG